MTARNETHSENMNGPAQQTVNEPHEGKYQIGRWSPEFLQCFNNPNGFLVVMVIAIISITMISGGLVNINAAPLERRFALDSTQAGSIVTGCDIGFVIMSLFISCYGMKISRPKMVAIGVAMFGLGCFFYSLPHFTTGTYNFETGQLQVTCPLPGQNATTCLQSENLSGYTAILLLGTILMGCGYTPFLTLGMAYLEDSVPKNLGPLYLGIANAGGILGPMTGFLAGGKFLLDFFVDFDSDLQAPFTNVDPRWVGAWWVLPLIAMVIAWIIVIPLAGFPRQLPGTNEIRAARESETHNDGGSQMVVSTEVGRSIREFPTALWIIVRNPVFVCITLATCCQWMTLNGLAAFFAKLVENEFHLSTGRAAVLSGAILVPAGALGHVLAGVIVTRMKWETQTILKFNIASLVIVVGLSPIGFVHCNNDNVAGVTVPYRYTEQLSSGALLHVNQTLREGNLTAGCNINCACQEEFYIPVCGDDGKTYFSPCQAGCTGSNFTNGSTTPFEYTLCRCVFSPAQKAYPGACSDGCSSLPVFLAIVFFATMFCFAPLTPSLVMTFRVVPEKMRSFAVGVQWLLISGIGSIPGPLIYGGLIDLTCMLWQTRQCDGSRGQCWIHNNTNMNLVYVCMSMVLNFSAALLYAAASCVYKPEYEVSVYSSEPQTKSQSKDVSMVEVSASENAGYEETKGDLQQDVPAVV